MLSRLRDENEHRLESHQAVLQGEFSLNRSYSQSAGRTMRQEESCLQCLCRGSLGEPQSDLIKCQFSAVLPKKKKKPEIRSHSMTKKINNQKSGCAACDILWLSSVVCPRCKHSLPRGEGAAARGVSRPTMALTSGESPQNDEWTYLWTWNL